MIAHPLKVRELLDEIARGEVVLPEFQRSYVWKPVQVVKLLDSLYRGFPAGQILLWDTGDLEVARPLEGVQPTGMRAPGRPKVVLDGQQRLTSLYQALAPEPAERLEVWFNLETDRFALHRKRMDQDPAWVAVRDVVTQRRHDLEILREIAARGGPGLDDPRCAVLLERLRGLRAIADFRFQVEMFRSQDYEAVSELFVRINSGGTRLRKAELVLAQLALHLPGVMSRRFEEAVERFEADGFALDTRFLVRALVAVATGQARFDALGALWQHTPAELEAVWERTEQALARALGFLRDRARFESSDWLPSLNALVPLVAFLDREPDLTREHEAGLLRWFYLVQLRGRYGAAVESTLTADLRALAEERPVVRLLDLVLTASARAEVDPEELDEADWRNPLFALSYAAARKAGARDLFTGAPVVATRAGLTSHVHVHPLFPRSLLAREGVPRARHDELANLVFLAAPPPAHATRQAPAKYLPKVEETDVARLRAQGVPLNRALWDVARFDDFVLARRELLAAAVNDLIDEPL